MNAARETPSTPLSTDVEVARIDTQEVLAATPFREFLELHGCSVIVNSPSPVFPRYHIAIGSMQFVKSIFSSVSEGSTKRIGIVWDGTSSESQLLTERLSTKIVRVDSYPFPSRSVSEIFSFFFTSDATILDLRRDKTPDPSPSEEHDKRDATARDSIVVTEEKNDRLPFDHALSVNDQDRIHALIADIFDRRPTHSKKSPSKKTVRHRMHSGFFLLFVFLLPFLWYVLSVGVSVASIGYAGKLLLSGDISGAERLSGVGLFWEQRAKESISLASGVLRVIGQDHRVRGQEEILSVIEDTAVSEQAVGRMFEAGQNLAPQLLVPVGTADRPALSPALLIEKLQNELFFIETRLGLTQANLMTLLDRRPFPFGFSFIQGVGSRASRALARLRQTVAELDRFITLYPAIAGFAEKKTYLILFQNSMELRPTGGFIGSIGLASFADGRLVDFQIQDVYTVDGQLRGHVDPPRPIAEILRQEHWYLRDSNWNSDFRTSAQQAAWFYEKETGQVVDGVIAVNSSFIVDLLRVTGPIELSDYNDRITAENFFAKSLYYTQENFFPGSTQKKDFLGTLASALITSLTNKRERNPSRVFHAVTRALARHDILFYFSLPSVQALVDQYGWSGSVPRVSHCVASVVGEDAGSTPCLLDYLFVSEANLSVNKGNYFVNRSGRRTIHIGEDGKVQESILFTYRNTSTGASREGGGPYHAYARFYLPPDAVVTGVTIDGVRVPERPTFLTVPPVPYMERGEQAQNLFLFGVAFVVPVGAERRVEVRYERTVALDMSRGRSVYELYTQKQPGIADESFGLTITYPIFWQAIEEFIDTETLSLVPATQSFLAKEAKLEYNTDLSRDRSVRMTFTK